MPSNTKKPITDVAAQEQYVASQGGQGSDKALGLVFAEAFVRGMRDLGYKSNGYALDEMIDNSIQASAHNVAVAFGFDKSNSTKKKHDHIAVIDDGIGMGEGMISFAVRWGGTHREGSRTLFGRYGYGLPSAAVSMTKTYSVYSKNEGGPWRCVDVNLDELAACEAGEADSRLTEKSGVELPDWIANYELNNSTVANLQSGTVILLKSVDRTDHATVRTMKAKLLEHFGLIYRNYLSTTAISVDGTEADPVDPLFLMEGCRHQNENFLRPIAVPVNPIEIRSKFDEKISGKIKVRASVLPMGFQHVDVKAGKGQNSRFHIMKENHGVILCRAGRQIDVITKGWGITWMTYDRNIKLEIDFDPALDEYFGITTSKQQINIDEKMMQILGDRGVLKLITQLRAEFRKTQADHSTKKENNEETGERASEHAMRTSADSKRKKPVAKSPKQKEESQRNVDQEVERLAQRDGLPEDDVKKLVDHRIENKPYDVEFESIPEGPFMRPALFGSQKRLYINTMHPFYTQLYDAPEVHSETRAALEVLLFCFADGELDAPETMERFYKNVRSEWTDRLRDSLDVLRSQEETNDNRDLKEAD